MYTPLIFIALASVHIFCYVECSSALVGRSYLEQYLGKRYELASSHNFDAVMEALGVGFIKMKLANLAKPVIELTEKDGEYTLSTESAFKNFFIFFRIGEEFEETTPDDRRVKSIITQEGNVLTQVQKGDKTVVIIREFTLDQVKVTILVDDIVSVRIYKVINS